MGFVNRNDRRDDEEAGRGLSLDLDLLACERCRRELLPWQETCPDDGGRAVPRTELPPPADPLAERLAALSEDEDEDGQSAR